MKIKPIRSKRDHREAVAEIERLWDAPKGSPQADRLDVLVTLVEAYEQKHEPIGPPDPIEAIKFRMEQMDLTRKDLEPLLGGRNRISEVMARKRPLSLAMIRRLHAALGIPLATLIADYHLAKSRPTAQKTRSA